MARKAAKKSRKKASKKSSKKASKRTYKKAAKKAAKKTVKKAVKKAARKAPRRTARRAAPVNSIIRPLDDRPETEVVLEFRGAYGSDPHSDPDVVEVSAAGRSLAAAAAQWRVAKALLKLRAQVNTMAPNRSKASDGTIGDNAHCGNPDSTSDHCPRIRDAGVGVVAAMDITHDPTGGCDAGKLANAIHASRDSRVKYIIWNRRIANSSAVNGSAPWEWRPYTRPNPHTRHVHISVKASKPQYDSESAWTLPGN